MKITTTYRQSGGLQRGFTLIEVLVSIVILAIGLLGLAGLQLQGMQNTQGGNFRAQATNLAYDITDRMRVNLTALTAGSYDIAMAAATPALVNCKGSDVNCTTANMATADLYWWRQGIDQYLVTGGSSVVTADNGVTTTVTVTVQWEDPYSSDNGLESIQIATELPRL